MLQNKEFHRHSLCSVMSHVVLFAYPTTLNISTKNRITKIPPKKFLNALCNRTKKILDKFSCHRRLMLSRSVAAGFKFDLFYRLS